MRTYPDKAPHSSLISNGPARVFNCVASARAHIALLDDPDWTYKVIPDPKGTGKAIVKIYDEEGYFVADLNF